MDSNTIAKPGEFDALEKAKPDELIFPLLERDPIAPKAIHFWVRKRRRLASKITDPDKRRAELAQCTEAEFIAIEMEQRQRGREGQAVERVTTSYSGATDPNAKRDALLGKMRSQLSEADYRANEARELMVEIAKLDPERLDPEMIVRITEAQRAIHQAVLDLSPHRRALLAEQELPLDEAEARALDD